MANSRKDQFRTETPFLPLPIAEDVLAAVCLPVTSMPEAEERHARIMALRSQVTAAIDTIEIALAQNHANYLGGRRAWSYDTSNEVKVRLRILKRQRQHLQDGTGVVTRWLKRAHHEQVTGSSGQVPVAAHRAQAFVVAAERLLAPETLAILWDMVESQQSTNGVGRGAS